MSISLVVLFGIALFICLARDNMSKLHAVIAVLFGLFLGATKVGPGIMEGTHDFLAWVSSLNL